MSLNSNEHDWSIYDVRQVKNIFSIHIFGIIKSNIIVSFMHVSFNESGAARTSYGTYHSIEIYQCHSSGVKVFVDLRAKIRRG